MKEFFIYPSWQQ